MRVLYVTYEPPFFPAGGGQTRQFNLLKHLSVKHEIDLFLPHLNLQERIIAKQISNSVYSPSLALTKLARLCLKPFPNSYPAFSAAKEGLRFTLTPIIRAAIKRNSYDLVHIEHTDIAHWEKIIPRSIPRTLTAHNVKTVMWSRYAKNASQSQYKALAKEARRFSEYEAKFLPALTRLIAVSDTDKLELERITEKSVPIDVVANGVDTTYFSPKSSEISYDLVFTGTMNHPPNTDGIIDFVIKTLPIIRSQIPGVRLAIVGMNPPPAVQSLSSHPGVTVTGYVPDTRDFISSATLAIAPLNSGSGTRLKILEAMSMGKAVVSTSIGAEGIDYRNGFDITISDSREAFAESIIELLQNEHLHDSIGNNARLLVIKKYDWRSLAELQDNAWRAATESPNTRTLSKAIEPPHADQN